MALTYALISSHSPNEQEEECYASVVVHLCSSRSSLDESLKVEGREVAVISLEKI